MKKVFWGLLPGETRILPDGFLDQTIDKIRYDLSELSERYGPNCKILVRDGKRYVHRASELHTDSGEMTAKS
jgi:hypothetical protein